MTPVATRRKPNSTSASWRPRPPFFPAFRDDPRAGAAAFPRGALFAPLPAMPIPSQPRAARPHVAPRLFGTRDHRLAGEQLPQRLAATGAHRLLRRADARSAPIAEGVLHDPVLSRVIGDDEEGPTGREPLAQRRQRVLQVTQLAVHRDAHRLEDPREVASVGARA